MNRRDADALLEHAAFVRALARRLVRDESTADDVAQQTWLAALEHPPRREPRSWLATVVRNVVSRMARTERRRERREAVAARPEHVPSTADRVGREEVLRSLTDAVLALPPAYRDVILMRFYEGLPPRRIAKELQVPVETVRTRVQRAVAKLRDTMDRGHGRRGAWSLALAALALRGRAGAAPAAWKGALAMSTKTKAGLAALVALLALIALWRVAGRSTPSPPRERTEARQIENTPGQATTHGPHETEDAPFLLVRVLDPDGAEIVGATINDMRTGSDGTCRLPLDPTRPGLRLSGHAPGYPHQELAYVPAWKRAVGVVLYPARAIRGRVLDPQGGPTAGARVYVDESPWDAEPPLATSTDEAGSFCFDERTPRGWPLQAHVAAFHPRGAVIEHLRRIAGNGDVFLELQLEAAVRTVTGRVVDLHDAPIEGADVVLWICGLGPQFDLADAHTITDAEGRFTLPARPRSAMAQVFVNAPGYGAARAGVGERDEVTVRIAPYSRLRGRVAWDDGTPVRDIGVEAIPAALTGTAFSPMLGEWEGMTATSNARGEFLLDRLPALQPLDFVSEAPSKTRFMLNLNGQVPTRLATPRFVRAPAGKETQVTITLPRPERTIRLRVLGPNGEPAPHTGLNVWRGDWVGNMTVGADGCGELGLYGKGNEVAFDLTSSQFGKRRIENIPIDDEIELRFDREPLTLRGLVVDTGGVPVRNAAVWISGTYWGTAVDPATGSFELIVNEDAPYVLDIRRSGVEQRVAGVRPGKPVRVVWRAEDSGLIDLVVRTEGEPESITVFGLDNGLRKTLLSGETELTVFRVPPGSYAVVASYEDAKTGPVLADAPADVLVRAGGGSPVTGTLTAPVGAETVFPCGMEFVDARTGVRVGRWSVNYRGQIRGPRLGRGSYRGQLFAPRSSLAFPLARVFTADGETPVDASTVLQAGGQLRVTIRWEDATPPWFLVIRHHGNVVRRVEVTGVQLAGEEPVVVSALAPGEYELVLGDHSHRVVVTDGEPTSVGLK